jgi:hypothetical protein
MRFEHLRLTDTPFANFEHLFFAEYPYLEQTDSWKVGMKYRYSPETYPLTLDQYESMKKSGVLLGQYLIESGYDNLLEFRVDYIKDRNGKLLLTEIQADDRGLPAVVIARNARGTNKNTFPGIEEPLINAVKNVSGNNKVDILITYPDREYFYYAGFNDLARIINARRSGVNIIPCAISNIKKGENTNKIIIPLEGLSFFIKPDLVWDFSNSCIVNAKYIQPMINKDILIKIWTDESPLAQKLRQFTPFTTSPLNKNVVRNKDTWVLKPIEGRWSRGVTFGFQENDAEWKRLVSESSENLVAQRFISPATEAFYSRRKPNYYTYDSYYSRVEGYYILTDGEWVLADVLATCTAELPVHGKRNCIMIPAEIKTLE